MKRWTRNWTGPVKGLFAGLGLAALALVVSAVMPPASTLIGNQAGATYTDAAGKPQTAQSNLVNTTVAQIGGLDMTGTNTKTVAPGDTVYMAHTLTNTGNGADTFKIAVADTGTNGGFSSIAIYPDANGTGVPSGPALCSGAAACSTGINQLVAGNGGTFAYLVVYQVPATASVAGLFDTATVTATATSAPGIPYATTTKSNIDTVKVTLGAAFNPVTKAIAAPAVAAPLGASWPAALTSGVASPLSCSTDPTATQWATNLVSTHTACSYTVYTISYSNTGGAAGEFTMQDPLPVGMTYVKGSAVWSGAPGIALQESGAANSNPNVISSFAGGTLKVSVLNVSANVTGTISFVAMVNSAAVVGATSTSNTAKYYSTSCDPTLPGNTPSNPCDGQTTPSGVVPPVAAGPTPFAVNPTYSAIASKDGSATAPDSSTPPPKTGVEITTQPTVAPGGSVPFFDVIKNNGNGTDTFNVSVPAFGKTVNGVNENTFPAGTSFSFYKADGVTPLTDTNGDGIPDTGPVNPGVTVTIVVIATIPASTAPTTTPLDALLTATSVGSGATTPVSDSVWNEVSKVEVPAAKVDLTNTAAGGTTIDGTTTPATTAACVTGSNCDIGQGPSSSPTDTQPTVPGTGVTFPVFLKNGDTTTTSYNLTATLPTGWTVKFVGPTGTCSDPAVTLPLGPVAPGAQTQVNACVTPPAGASTGGAPTNFTITATSTTNPAVTDSITDAVKTIAPTTKLLGLTPGTNTGVISDGGSSVQPVTLNNLGNQACGTSSAGFNVTATLDSASAAAGWTVSVYYDKDASSTVTAGDPALAAATSAANLLLGSPGNLTTTVAPGYVQLAPGAGLPLLVKFIAPGNAPINSIATVTFTVDDLTTPASAACPSQTGSYKMVVTNGQLRLVKTEAYDKACTGSALSTAFVSGDASTKLTVAPGECIVYKVVATNQGNAPVSNVVINDVIPSYTTYLGSATQVCAVVGGTPPAVSTFLLTGTQITCTYPAALNPAGTLTLQFPVQINQ